MTQKVKKQTSKGQRAENKTNCLVRVENGDIKIFSNEKIQEVLVHTDRKGVIEIINTILENAGQTRRISSKDNFERILNVWDFIHNNLNVNLSNLIKGDSCKSRKLRKQIKYLRSLNNQELFIQEIKKEKRNAYFLKLIITSDNDKLWREIIRQFPCSEWIIDHIQIQDEKLLGHIHTGSYLYANDVDGLGYYDCGTSDFDTMERVYPIHFGLKKNSILLSEIKRDEDRLQNADESKYPFDINYFGKVVKVYNSTDFMKVITDKQLSFQINAIKWRGLLNFLYTNPEMVDVLDRFSPYYFDILEGEEAA